MESKPFSIGELSRITGLSVKTLRFYHEKGILEPSSVDPATGYRYYDSSPYDQLGRSYAKILSHANQLGLKLVLPTREVYLKGPGMIFRGNPVRYLTEIQLPLEAAGGLLPGGPA
ncbi:MAG TPA: MerR family DNA-binding transcriptional regulator [Planctomycetota bacterium]|nr:MerR family DNA-binding transcriptional regulator [Planctomycetota bacterium]